MRISVLEGLKQRRLVDIQVETEEMVDRSKVKAEPCAPGLRRIVKAVEDISSDKGVVYITNSRGPRTEA